MKKFYFVSFQWQILVLVVCCSFSVRFMSVNVSLYIIRISSTYQKYPAVLCFSSIWNVLVYSRVVEILQVDLQRRELPLLVLIHVCSVPFSVVMRSCLLCLFFT